jgi:hypothetical protein
MANAPDKKSYEEQWQQAFDEAEMPPSPNVWKSIDQELTAQESGKYKKGFFFYRAVAAALLLCIAGLSWYILSWPTDSSEVAQDAASKTEQSIAPLDEADQESNLASDSSTGSINQTESKEEANSSLADNDNMNLPGGDDSSSASGNLTSGLTDNDNAAAGDRNQSSANNKAQLAIRKTKEPASAAKTLIFPNEGVSQREEELLSINHRVGRVAALPPDVLALSAPTWAENIEKLYLVPQYRKQEASTDQKSKTQFFAGLAMAPSLFDPNFQSQNEATLAVADAPLAESYSYALADGLTNARAASSNTVMVAEGLDNQSSVSLSYGFDVGLTLGEHWSIESGLDYQNFQTVTQTQYSVVDLQSGERYPLLATNAAASKATAFNVASASSSSEVDNQFQFISVPLRVGYNLHFSKITLSINPGIAANLFLGNRISSQDFASTTLSNDGNSPFNSQYISGLLSGGVFYQLLENYSLSFSPSYQFALSDFARSAATFNSLPQSLGLKFGFRYNFQ